MRCNTPRNSKDLIIKVALNVEGVGVIRGWSGESMMNLSGRPRTFTRTYKDQGLGLKILVSAGQSRPSRSDRRRRSSGGDSSSASRFVIVVSIAVGSLIWLAVLSITRLSV